MSCLSTSTPGRLLFFVECIIGYMEKNTYLVPWGPEFDKGLNKLFLVCLRLGPHTCCLFEAKAAYIDINWILPSGLIQYTLDGILYCILLYQGLSQRL